MDENQEQELIYDVKQKSVVFDSCSCQLTIIKEVTDLIKAEQLKTTQHLTEIMVASTSHDMRTPLNTIVNMHELILNQIVDPQLHKWLMVSKNST